MLIQHSYLDFGVQAQQGANVQYNIVQRVGDPLDPSVKPLLRNMGFIYGQIENQGTVATTLTIQGSTDNNQTDLFSGHALNFTTIAGAVSSVTVQPGGRAEFVLLYSTVSPFQYLKLITTFQSCGKIGLVYWNGQIEEKPLQGLP